MPHSLVSGRAGRQGFFGVFFLASMAAAAAPHSKLKLSITLEAAAMTFLWPRVSRMWRYGVARRTRFLPALRLPVHRLPSLCLRMAPQASRCLSRNDLRSMIGNFPDSDFKAY